MKKEHDPHLVGFPGSPICLEKKTWNDCAEVPREYGTEAFEMPKSRMGVERAPSGT